MREFNKFDDDQYDHDLVTMLEILKRIDLSQFAIDLRANQPDTYELIKSIFLNNPPKEIRYKF